MHISASTMRMLFRQANSLKRYEGKSSSWRICFDVPQVCSFGNNVFITER